MSLGRWWRQISTQIAGVTEPTNSAPYCRQQYDAEVVTLPCCSECFVLDSMAPTGGNLIGMCPTEEHGSMAPLEDLE
jgi:hypothetical protein